MTTSESDSTSKLQGEVHKLHKELNDATQAKLSAFSEVERLERLVADLESEVSSLSWQLDLCHEGLYE